MLRYSLRSLLIAVLGVALFCAALANATEPWRDAAKLALWLFLLTSLTAAVASRERTRAIAWGMAVFGFGFHFVDQDYPGRPEFVVSAVDWGFVALHGSPPGQVDDGLAPAPAGGLESAYPSTTIQGFMRQPRPGNGIIGDDTSYEARNSHIKRQACFSQIAFVGIAVLLSIFGGVLGTVFYTRSYSCANKTPS